MLIFDKFPSRKHAEKFAAAYEGEVFDSQSESNSVDWFPYVLHPPIVLIERPENPVHEDRIILKVKSFGGEFAGT